MNTQPQDMQAIHRRIDALERQNRWLMRAGLVGSLLVVAAVTMGQARPSRIAEAERFVLKDMNGRTRGDMFVADDSPTFRLYNSNGEEQVAIGTDPKMGPYLHLLDPASNADFIVHLEPLMGAKLGFASASGKSGVAFSTVGGGAGLRIVDEAGYSAVLGTSDLVAKRTGDKRTTSAASLKLCDQEGKVIWSAP